MPTAARPDEVLARIRALLAQAESTSFPREAEAFTAKATELMVRYAVDEALVWATEEGSDAPSEIRIELYRPFVPPKAVLVHEVAQAFGCRAIRLGRDSATGVEPVAIIGYRSDLSMVELLVTSLLVQLTTAMNESVSDERTAAQIASYRRSFIMGFTDVVTRRLAEQSRQARQERDAPATPPGPAARPSLSSTDIVLADRAATVHEDFRRRFPKVRTSSISAGSSSAGRAAGSRAGHRADLGGRRLSDRRSLEPRR